ncbi:MAG TPA: oligogalacturonate lyase family protein [Candidatus Limnocylindrales bacterium]|nr:oligogalacturonate lyase family protein [Candidatus Limnocylindrales bacterium]
MAGSFTRRGFLLIAGAAGALAQQAESKKGQTFPSDSHRYPDPLTEFDVFRLTDPGYASTLPAWYNRAVAKNNTFLIFCCDRTGAPQAFRLDFKTAQTHQLTAAEELDGESLTLTPDNRAICYFAGRSLYHGSLGSLSDRKLYTVPEGWERCPGMSVGPDGTHAVFGEKKGETSRLRMVSLIQSVARTVVEAPFVLSHPIARPMRAQILYRRGDESLFLVNADGQQNRQLKLAPGTVATANWSPDGKTVLYLSFPDDQKQLHQIRECTPGSGTDKMIAKTSHFASFGWNRDASVFVGASANVGSPTVLLMIRLTRRELTLCEHKASDARAVAPIFQPDSQRIFFQSDRDGKSAIYDMHVDKLVEKTDVEG